MTDNSPAFKLGRSVGHAEATLESGAEKATLRAALLRACRETDYCYICDNHPSHGHAKDCILVSEPAKSKLSE